MLAKNPINRNKMYYKAKIDNKNIDFMPFIQTISMDTSSGSSGQKKTVVLYCTQNLGHKILGADFL